MVIQQLMNEAEQGMKNLPNRGGYVIHRGLDSGCYEYKGLVCKYTSNSRCCPSRCLLAMFRQQLAVKRVKCSAECYAIFVFTTKTTPLRLQLFSVNRALTCKCAALLTSLVDLLQNFSKFAQQQLLMLNYACAFSQLIGIFWVIRT